LLPAGSPGSVAQPALRLRSPAGGPISALSVAMQFGGKLDRGNLSFDCIVGLYRACPKGGNPEGKGVKEKEA
jgi:hypothetical protein